MIYQFEHDEIKHCYECPLVDSEYGDCNITGTEGVDCAIPADCPLVAISNCEWCNGKEYIIDSRDYTCLGITGNKLAAWGEGEATGYVNYCPNCGRRLEGKE